MPPVGNLPINRFNPSCGVFLLFLFTSTFTIHNFAAGGCAFPKNMSKILYYLFLKPISFIPLRGLYIISDFMYMVLYVLLKYRQKVVRTNLLNSLPEKDIKDILKIEKAFYRHFCDLIVESVRMFSISEKELKERSKMVNPEVMDGLYDKNKSIILTGGHYNNWEIGAAILSRQVKHHIIGIYAPLSNAFFNDKILKSRSRFGMEMLSKKRVKEGFEQHKGELTATIFATDQSPTYSKMVHWTTFLNQPTAVALGAELFAAEYKLPVVFVYVTKQKRGYYQMEARLLCEDASKMKAGEITELHTRWLEDQIRQTPQFWLWTHKRWKRRIKEEESLYKA